MNWIRKLLIWLHILPKSEPRPTQNDLLHAAVEQRVCEMEARLRMLDLEIRNIQRKE